MRKALSAVLAAAALFGGAAISNGAANATDGERPSGADYVIKGDCYEQGVVDGVQYEKCDIIPDEDKDNTYVYAIAYGIYDKGATDLTMHATYNNVDVLQFGRYENMTKDTNLKNLTIESNGIHGWPKTRTYARVAASFQSKLENVNFNGAFSVADNAFNGAYANVWKHLPDGSGKASFVDTKEYSAFATCTVSE